MEYLVRCCGCTKISSMVGSKQDAEHLARTHVRARGHTVSIIELEVKSFRTITPTENLDLQGKEG